VAHPPGVVSGLPGLRNGTPGLEKRHAHPDRWPGERNGLGSMPKLVLGAANLARSRLQLVAMLGILRRHQHRPRLRPRLLPGQPQIVRIGPGAGGNGPGRFAPQPRAVRRLSWPAAGPGPFSPKRIEGVGQHLSRKRELLGPRPLAGHRSVAPSGAGGAARLDSAPACSGDLSIETAIQFRHWPCRTGSPPRRRFPPCLSACLACSACAERHRPTHHRTAHIME